ncbi:MAG: ribbon-helix-helix domain-containing protein [Alphaproteobacteria bacterium]|nr:ribbon-helix-helix domain-containing protein [Alphaproteobacteria bacterium]
MLVNRNITVGDLRTSVRLEPQFWTALTDIATREGLSVDELCTLIDAHLGELGRTAGIRVFIASYFAADREARSRVRFENTVRPVPAFTPAQPAARRAFG